MDTDALQREELNIKGMFFFSNVRFYLDFEGSHFDTGNPFCLSSSVQVLPLDVTTPRDSYAWNCRELANFLTLKFSSGWFRTTDQRARVLPLSYPDTVKSMSHASRTQSTFFSSSSLLLFSSLFSSPLLLLFSSSSPPLLLLFSSSSPPLLLLFSSSSPPLLLLFSSSSSSSPSSGFISTVRMSVYLNPHHGLSGIGAVPMWQLDAYSQYFSFVHSSYRHSQRARHTPQWAA